MTGSASRKPRRVGGVEGRIEKRTLPYREGHALWAGSFKVGKVESKVRSREGAGGEPVIAVERLTARFGEETILENVSFEAHRGEILCIVGESGCGKSTLLRHLVGLIRPAAGRVLVWGVDIAAAGERELNSIRKKIGVLFQSDALMASMTLGGNVGLPLDGRPRRSHEPGDVAIFGTGHLRRWGCPETDRSLESRSGHFTFAGCLKVPGCKALEILSREAYLFVR